MIDSAAIPTQFMMVKHVDCTPTTFITHSPETSNSAVTNFHGLIGPAASFEKMETRHCLAGQFPTVSLFKDYENAAMTILEKSDYTMISGNLILRNHAGGKFHFTSICHIKLKTTIEYDENRNVQHAEFTVHAHMQGGRFSDGWCSCERREKVFPKPNHEIPSTSETRAKNRACQDLLGIDKFVRFEV